MSDATFTDKYQDVAKRRQSTPYNQRTAPWLSSFSIPREDTHGRTAGKWCSWFWLSWPERSRWKTLGSDTVHEPPGRSTRDALSRAGGTTAVPSRPPGSALVTCETIWSRRRLLRPQATIRAESISWTDLVKFNVIVANSVDKKTRMLHCLDHWPSLLTGVVVLPTLKMISSGVLLRI